MRFQTFGDPELEKLMEAGREWYGAMKGGHPPRWLSILGSSGTGKTHSARRLWDWANPRFDWSACLYSHRIVYWPHFIQALKSGNSYDFRNDLMRWPVLFLDDVGSERDTSGFASDELNTLLGARVGKWTLLTSNLSFERFENLDARIASRLIRDRNICVSLSAADFSTRTVLPVPVKKERERVVIEDQEELPEAVPAGVIRQITFGMDPAGAVASRPVEPPAAS